VDLNFGSIGINCLFGIELSLNVDFKKSAGGWCPSHAGHLVEFIHSRRVALAAVFQRIKLCMYWFV